MHTKYGIHPYYILKNSVVTPPFLDIDEYNITRKVCVKLKSHDMFPGKLIVSNKHMIALCDQVHSSGMLYLLM